ncbi:MAG TPA: ATP-binding protein [Longimicrobiales bacterium]|nr:ATP-binding protein [Longimicrobiales bacterium]
MARRDTRQGGLPAILIVLVLLAVVVILVPVQARIDALRAEVEEVAEPGADLVAEIQYLLARQTSSLRGYLISRDTTYLDQYAALRAREREIYPELERHAVTLSPDVAADVAEIRTLADLWHRRLQVEALVAAGATPESTVVLLEQELYRETLEAASRAAQSIRQLTRARQARIDRVERNARFIYAFLFLLASLVAVSTAVLNARVRSLAAETEGRRAEIEVAMERTARAVAARADLVRGFTHDVKNPLGVADGYAELLELGLRGTLAPPQLETVGRIRSSIRGAIEITNELLDLSRMESGGLQVRREPFDLRALVREVVQQHVMAASAAGLELRFMDGRAPNPKTTIYTDPDRVRQILQNVISNALKYTPPPGEVTVRIDFRSGSTETPGAWAHVSVTDTGVGIPVQEQDRIFDEFHRVPGSGASGHGLGLAISRRIARLLGGDVSVHSDPGEGATFVLSLPLRQEAS